MPRSERGRRVARPGRRRTAAGRPRARGGAEPAAGRAPWAAGGGGPRPPPPATGGRAVPGRDLRAGEANSFMEPILGSHSVLVLDGPEHLRQRKLLLPPFQGSRVAAFREVIRDVAEREIAGWRPGTELVLRERMRALTFEVICRAVFGVTQPER